MHAQYQEGNDSEVQLWASHQDMPNGLTSLQQAMSCLIDMHPICSMCRSPVHLDLRHGLRLHLKRFGFCY